MLSFFFFLPGITTEVASLWDRVTFSNRPSSCSEELGSTSDGKKQSSDQIKVKCVYCSFEKLISISFVAAQEGPVDHAEDFMSDYVQV